MNYAVWITCTGKPDITPVLSALLLKGYTVTLSDQVGTSLITVFYVSVGDKNTAPAVELNVDHPGPDISVVSGDLHNILQAHCPAYMSVVLSCPYLSRVSSVDQHGGTSIGIMVNNVVYYWVSTTPQPKSDKTGWNQLNEDALG